MSDHDVEVGAGVQVSAAQAEAAQPRCVFADAAPGAAQVAALEGAGNGGGQRATVVAVEGSRSRCAINGIDSLDVDPSAASGNGGV